MSGSLSDTVCRLRAPLTFVVLYVLFYHIYIYTLCVARAGRPWWLGVYLHLSSLYIGKDWGVRSHLLCMLGCRSIEDRLSGAVFMTASYLVTFACVLDLLNVLNAERTTQHGGINSSIY